MRAYGPPAVPGTPGRIAHEQPFTRPLLSVLMGSGEDVCAALTHAARRAVHARTLLVY